PTAREVGFGGRVNKSAVAGILARVYLYWAGEPIKDVSKYQNAKDWAYAVISSAEHELNPSFDDVFRRLAADEYDIKESIWEVEFFGNRTGRPRQDRKSTRLNSSHVKISYAVFCLKKKKGDRRVGT